MSDLTKPKGRVLPQKFTLTVEEDIRISGWWITSDAHQGFLQVVLHEEGLPEGLRKTPASLREILVAQMDADAEALHGNL